MILSDSKILEQIESSDIVIQPFDRACLGSNSYDVHLGHVLLRYPDYPDSVLDCKQQYTINRDMIQIDIPDDGYILEPNTLYLGVTKEYTETHNAVPFIEGKSSIGRLGISVHCTAGRGDAGFCNYWTLEITVVQPVRVYAGMPIAQLIYFALNGKVSTPYHAKADAKYNALCSMPVPSQMWKNFSDHK